VHPYLGVTPKKRNLRLGTLRFFVVPDFNSNIPIARTIRAVRLGVFLQENREIFHRDKGSHIFGGMASPTYGPLFTS